MLKVRLSNLNNYSWRRFNRDRAVTQTRNPVIATQNRIFTMGSCFAVEIKAALRKSGVEVFPDYQSIRSDPKKHIVPVSQADNLEAINHYNTFSIRQEFERIDGGWRQDPKDYWEVKATDAERDVKNVDTMYQDPYRRNIRAVSPQDLNFLVKTLDEVIQEGFHRADHFIFTLGLIEAWFRPSTGKAICQYPGYTYGGGDDCTFRLTSYEENLDNMRTVLSIVQRLKPEAKVFITVSPVPLELTFSKRDIVVANMESKAVLLAVAHQLCREFPSVTYFPSFEIVAFNQGAFREDGRHVKREVVEGIVQCFQHAFMETPTKIGQKAV